MLNSDQLQTVSRPQDFGWMLSPRMPGTQVSGTGITSLIFNARDNPKFDSLSYWQESKRMCTCVCVYARD